MTTDWRRMNIIRAIETLFENALVTDSTAGELLNRYDERREFLDTLELVDRYENRGEPVSLGEALDELMTGHLARPDHSQEHDQEDEVSKSH